MSAKKKRLISVVVLLLVAAFSCLFGWRVMPRLWKWAKGVFAAPAVVEREPYIPESTASLEDAFAQGDSVVYYFYKDNCPYCEEIDAFFKGLPDEIPLPDGTMSKVELVCINKNVDYAPCLAYYEEAHIPENRRFVPAVAVGSSYLFTPSEILEGLYSGLLAGDGLDTPMIGDNHREP